MVPRDSIIGRPLAPSLSLCHTQSHHYEHFDVTIPTATHEASKTYNLTRNRSQVRLTGRYLENAGRCLHGGAALRS